MEFRRAGGFSEETSIAVFFGWFLLHPKCIQCWVQAISWVLGLKFGLYESLDMGSKHHISTCPIPPACHRFPIIHGPTGIPRCSTPCCNGYLVEWGISKFTRPKMETSYMFQQLQMYSTIQYSTYPRWLYICIILITLLIALPMKSVLSMSLACPNGWLRRALLAGC